MLSLPKTTHDHHQTIKAHVARLPKLAEMIGGERTEEFAASFEREYAFISEQLVPHMSTIERTL